MNSVCASGLSLLPAHSISLAFCLSSPPQKDPAYYRLSHWSSLIPGPQTDGVSDKTRSPYSGLALWLISNITSFPPPDSFKMIVLLFYFTNEETETKANSTTINIHLASIGQSWDSNLCSSLPPQNSCPINMLVNFSHSPLEYDPGASIVHIIGSFLQIRITEA